MVEPDKLNLTTFSKVGYYIFVVVCGVFWQLGFFRLPTRASLIVHGQTTLHFLAIAAHARVALLALLARRQHRLTLLVIDISVVLLLSLLLLLSCKVCFSDIRW